MRCDIYIYIYINTQDDNYYIEKIYPITSLINNSNKITHNYMIFFFIYFSYHYKNKIYQYLLYLIKYLFLNLWLKYFFDPIFVKFFQISHNFCCVQIGLNFRQFCSIGSFFANTV